MACNSSSMIACTIGSALMLLGISGGCTSAGNSGPPPSGDTCPGVAPYGYYPTCWRAWPELRAGYPVPHVPGAGVGPEVIYRLDMGPRETASPGSAVPPSLSPVAPPRSEPEHPVPPVFPPTPSEPPGSQPTDPVSPLLELLESGEPLPDI